MEAVVIALGKSHSVLVVANRHEFRGLDAGALLRLGGERAAAREAARAAEAAAEAAEAAAAVAAAAAAAAQEAAVAAAAEGQASRQKEVRLKFVCVCAARLLARCAPGVGAME
jgi:hypothetical protein